METYLEKLLSQIRCKKARPYIAEEIRDHIECQIADNLSEGMTSEEAEKNAVTDMGDPVEVGISLDRIHKPKIAWKLLVIVGILSLLGILIQQSILRQPGYQELETWRQEVYRYTTEGFVSAVAIGFLLMCVIYFLDYTVIAKYSRFIGGAILILGGLRVAGFGGLDVDGIGNWIGFGRLRVAVTSLMMFYVPIYGAILYKYRDGGVSALCDPVADSSCIYYIPNPQPRCGCHRDGQYADRTYGGCLEGVVSTACEKDDYRHVAAFYGRACPGIDCNVCTSHVGSLSGSQDPLLFIPFRRCQLHDGHAS